MRKPWDPAVPKPWESEQAAFAFLLRVLAVCVVLALLSFAFKAIF